MKLVITEFMNEASVATLTGRLDTRYDPTLVDNRPALLAAIAGIDALIVRNRTRVDQALLDAAPRLRVVGRLGVGLDNIDMKACAARQVAVIPATGANAAAVAEYVIASALILTRKAYFHSAPTAAGAWPRAALSGGHEIAGKTLGLIGFGSIGRLTARLAMALGMTTIAHDPALAADAAVWRESGVAPRSFNDVLRESDVISLHVPLIAQTRNLIDAAALSAMKPGAALINTSRGGIVDEAALAQALQSGHLGGAAIDVFATEPLPAGSPLAAAPNLLLTPHIAGVTVESNQRVGELIARRVLEWLEAH
ncbi:MAG: hydroxyacid dehydrogenase [Candidimonas sp.]|nr:MAG: hydroxyacid dehydrogenase [Candidimonas sp.]